MKNHKMATKYFTLGLTIILMGCSTKPPQMKKYFSSDDSFSIDVPIDYSVSKSDSPDFIAFISDKQSGIIRISRMLYYAVEDLRQYAKVDMEKTPQKYTRTLVFDNDSICKYKCNIGTTAFPIITHIYYMKKVSGNYSYIVRADGTSLNDETIGMIYESIKPKSPRMRKYFSADKSFCIDVPINFSQSYNDAHALVFQSEYPFDIIAIERTLLHPLSAKEFKEFIEYDQAGIPQQFQPTQLIFENDTICSYEYNVGTKTIPMITYTYYIKKDIGKHSYVVKANGLSLNDEIIKKMYNSIKIN